MSVSYAYGPTYTSGGEDPKVVELRDWIVKQDATIEEWRSLAMNQERIIAELRIGMTDQDAEIQRLRAEVARMTILLQSRPLEPVDFTVTCGEVTFDPDCGSSGVAVANYPFGEAQP